MWHILNNWSSKYLVCMFTQLQITCLPMLSITVMHLNMCIYT